MLGNLLFRSQRGVVWTLVPFMRGVRVAYLLANVGLFRYNKSIDLYLFTHGDLFKTSMASSSKWSASKHVSSFLNKRFL